MTIVTDAFEPLAQSVAGAAGLARVPVLALRHPAGTLSEDDLRQRLGAALPALLEAAFGPGALLPSAPVPGEGVSVAAGPPRTR